MSVPAAVLGGDGGGIEVPYHWDPEPHQMPLWRYLENGGTRAVCLWHRRAGKDTTSLRWTTVAALTHPGVYWHMLPSLQQARRVVWNGRVRNREDPDAPDFPVLDAWPKEVIARKRDDEMMLELTNGSIWQCVGSDNYDSLVGTNPRGVVFSEWALADVTAWQFIEPILTENGGWAIFIFTPRGRNPAWKMYEMARENPNWFGQLLTVEDTGIVPISHIDELRASGTPEEIIQQEWYCSPDAPLQGAYYSDQLLWLQSQKPSRIARVPHDPNLRVHTAWDLGIGDETAIWFFQDYGIERRFIDYYENSGEPLAHYVAVLDEKARKSTKIDGYNYGSHVFPHDVRARELISGISREQSLREMGIHPEVIELHRLEDGIEAVRQMLPKCWFDWHNCGLGLAALRQYRKEKDEKHSDAEHTAWKNRPVHDWTSHAADAIRQAAMWRPRAPQARLPKRRRRRI